jgi:hypothetical protein
MPNFKRLLQCAKKFEDLQISRKTKDVDEIQKFNLQKEYHQHITMLQNLDADRAYIESQKDGLEGIITEEQGRIEIKTNELLEAEAFDQEAFENPVNSGEFQSISETQKTSAINWQEPLKQLPAGSSDLFDQEMSDVTEVCLQRELEKNDAAIKQVQEEEEVSSSQKTRKSPLFLRGHSI